MALGSRSSKMEIALRASMGRGTGMERARSSIAMETSLKDSTLMARLLRVPSTLKVATLRNVSTRMERHMVSARKSFKMETDLRACM